jgi:exosortase A
MNTLRKHLAWDELRRAAPSLLPALLLLGALLWLFRETATAMVHIWIRSETFTHAFLVPPISLWLAWQRRDELAAATKKPLPWLLLPVLAVCALWLLGELVSANSVTQFALVTLIVLCVPALFGWAVTRLVLFPLLFLYFAVPLGEFLVPTMMEATADFTVMALQLTGIPVYRDGLQFVIPSGNWSVVEACSGVRYLIASFMVGTLFAYINFNSTQRRLMFVAVSILVPVVANWFRAYMIVMLGHLSGNTIAVGADHLIYGWVFFGVVIMIMFMIGARWSEPAEDNRVAAAMPGVPSAPQSTSPMRSPWLVLLALLVLMGATQGFMWQLEQRGDKRVPVVELPTGSAAGWPRDATPSSWTPAFSQPSAVATAGYKGAPGVVGVWVGYYRAQNYQRKLVTSTNTMASEAWVQVSAGSVAAPTAAGPVQVRSAELRPSLATAGVAGAAPNGNERLRVWQLYWVGGRWTASDLRAKWYLAVDRLLGQGDDGAVVFMYTPLLPAADAAQAMAAADKTLAAFAQAQLTTLGDALNAARQAKTAAAPR